MNGVDISFMVFSLITLIKIAVMFEQSMSGKEDERL